MGWPGLPEELLPRERLIMGRHAKPAIVLVPVLDTGTGAVTHIRDSEVADAVSRHESTVARWRATLAGFWTEPDPNAWIWE